jgi:hypothetical protein
MKNRSNVIGIIHRFSRLVTLLFHKWLHVRLNHQDACISRKLNDLMTAPNLDSANIEGLISTAQGGINC